MTYSLRNTLHSSTYVKSKKLQFWLMQICLFSVANTFIIFAFKKPLNFDHIWPWKFEFLLLPVTLRHFLWLRWGFYCKYCFSMTKMPVAFWTLAFKFFVLFLKIAVIYVIILSRKVKNTFTEVKLYRTFFSNLGVLMSCFI